MRKKTIKTEDKLQPEDRLQPSEPTESRIEPKIENKEPPKEVDYLKKYQYRKEAVTGSDKSNPQPGSKAALMKRMLLEQERIRVFIPRAGGESPTITQSVTLNGYRLDFPKQTYIEVPMQIAETIFDALGQTEAALLRNQISGDKEKESALL